MAPSADFPDYRPDPYHHHHEDHSKKRNGKRIIILCDGTWQDAESTPEKRKPPTNIIRLARAIKPEARVQGEDGCLVNIDQVVFYQSGVGTGTLDSLIGGAIGVGLSEKIRSAYAFLANNYLKGDKIYIFGFSRGAFTARAIAGLITKMGLLDKRGMDNFPLVYKEYYTMPKNLTLEEEEARYQDSRDKYNLYRPKLGALEVIGVFDTVGFHRPVTGYVPWLNSFFGEQYELNNTTLPTGVHYAFHALSLDESRYAFKPTLWYQPKEKIVYKEDPKFETKMVQCWFSGEHSDVGGGKQDPRLSNISLGWMVSQLVEHKLLELDADYLLEADNTDHKISAHRRWATVEGEGGKWWEGQNQIERLFLAFVFFWVGLLIDTAQFFGFQQCLGLRTPGMYHKEGFVTNETIHKSVRDRKLNRANLDRKFYGPFGLWKRFSEPRWACKALRDWKMMDKFDEHGKPVLQVDKHGHQMYVLNKNQPVPETDKSGKPIYEKTWRKLVRGEVFTLDEERPTYLEIRCKNNIRSANPMYAQEVFKFKKDCHKFHPFDNNGPYKEEQETINAYANAKLNGTNNPHHNNNKQGVTKDKK
ncbi:hypothetical protein BP6252_07589 [Coleophoma cylindrospora]|uniref:T6SS Phospholipase effector Tle1-like catalytic domain-containing protein n=1 Tax=Coleophoma cylindrospora TaxID=1849047 RepID=A0A3D8RAM6_9HELO|nr:hypothetical protein BP6252_07589 [Coleophoma cylindrospora]